VRYSLLLRQRLRRSARGPSEEDSVSGLWLMLVAILAGAGLALGATFAVTGALAGANSSPVNQQLYNYGSR
jgi:hypothetical protein